MNDVYPWCIVAFDSLQRTPAGRLDMITDLGFDSYAYDLDIKHLGDMESEFKLASDKHIEIRAVWLWLNAKRDSIGKLSSRNEGLFELVKQSDHKPAFWLSFSPNFFANRTDDESFQIATDMILYVHKKATELDCKVELYNHGGWFGDPWNMVKLIQALSDLDLHMVYNFHHAHQDLVAYQEVIELITPYLSAVNINGMRLDGPKILTVGEGDYEGEMIRLLKVNGYKGPWGILGHVKEEDVRVVLERNMAWLRSSR